MSTQLMALLMFLLLTYLLFKRPASATPGRCPSELNSGVGHSICRKGESLREKPASVSSRRKGNKSLPRHVALGLAMGLLTGAAMAQTPANAQVRLAVAGNDSKVDKEDKKEGSAANDRAKDGKDNA
ncbi:MAG: hypothetical protein ACREBD_35890, partial [Blastocatellia bacterium]